MKPYQVSKYVLTGIAIAVVTCAGAQTNGPAGVSLRIGTFMPTNGAARDLGTNWVAFGADFKLDRITPGVPGVGLRSYLGLSADYFGHGGDFDVPVALTYNIRAQQIVFSAGIGPEFRNASDVTDTGVGVSGQLGVAFELGNMPTPIFLQAKYFFSSRQELSGLGLYLGVRF